MGLSRYQTKTIQFIHFKLGLDLYCGESALSLQEGPLLFMLVMSCGGRNRPSSAALCPRDYTSLQGLPCRKGHFSIIPQSVRLLLCTLMDQMDLRLAPSAPHLSFSPSLYYSVFVYFLSLSQSAYFFISLSLSLFLFTSLSRFLSLFSVFWLSCP